MERNSPYIAWTAIFRTEHGYALNRGYLLAETRNHAILAKTKKEFTLNLDITSGDEGKQAYSETCQEYYETF